MNGAQYYIPKGKSVEIFHEGNTFQNHNLPFQTSRTFLPLPSVGYPSHCGLQLPRNYGTLCVPSHLIVGNLKHHFLLELPWPPRQKHILTQLSTMVLTIIYCNCLLTCLTGFHPLNCEAGIMFCSLPRPKAVPRHTVETQHMLYFFTQNPHFVPWQTTSLIIQDTIPSAKVSCFGPKQSKWFPLHLPQ